jgi:hypothetical protein
MLIVALLSIIDILGGFFVINNHMFLFVKSFVIYFVFYFILKGFWSLATSLGSGYLFDWLGVIDLVLGIILLLMGNNVSLGFFYIIGWAEIAKGGYCFLRSLVGV